MTVICCQSLCVRSCEPGALATKISLWKFELGVCIAKSMFSFCVGLWEIVGVTSRWKYFRAQTAQLCIKLEEHMCKLCPAKCLLSYLMEGGDRQKLEECRRKLFGTLRQLGENIHVSIPKGLKPSVFQINFK